LAASISLNAGDLINQTTTDMKNLSIIYFAAVSILFLNACNTGTKSEKATPSVLGTWEYTGNLEGMAIVNEKEFIFMASYKPASSFGDSLTDASKLDRFNNLIIAAGTHSIQDSVVTCTNKYHINPNLVGVTWKWTYSLKEDELHWKVLDENGKVTNEGDSKRMKNL
jgi:hypothetical protein